MYLICMLIDITEQILKITDYNFFLIEIII